MARPLETASSSRYTHAQVEAKMRSGAAIVQPRFDLYDVNGNFLAPLRGVEGATIGFDITRPVPGLLQLKMQANSLPGAQNPFDNGWLRNVPFQYLVKPYFGIGPMDDGLMAEWPVGLYLWSRPKRSIHGTAGAPWGSSEVWEVDCGDQNQLLTFAGPGPAGFSAAPDQTITDVIKNVLNRAGVYDTSGVGDVPILVGVWQQWLAWTSQTGIWGSLRDSTAKPSTTQTWQNVLVDLQSEIGCEVPHFDLDGKYQTRPSDPWDLRSPTITYDTSGGLGLSILPVTTQPDMSKIANRVFAVGSDGTNQIIATVDLNDYFPQHPLAQRQTRCFVDTTIQVPGAVNWFILYIAAANELVRRISEYETITLKTVGFLAVHEANEMIGLRVENDPELASTNPGLFGAVQQLINDVQQIIGPFGFVPQTHLFVERAWTLDLFTSEMAHTLGRTWRSY